MESILLIIELYLLIITLDVLLGWLQPDPDRWPRRPFHALTEPLQTPLRAAVPASWTGGLDLSPLALVAALGMLRLLLLAWF